MKFASKTALLAASALSMNYAMPALAQDAQEEADDAGSGNDIIVTAQRVEQRLQDVPISITVLNQSTLTNNNVANVKDLVSYTPGLTVNNRYGADNTVFSIRGFTQDQRTFATVGTYFADVVMPRGGGATFGGDGAGPGSLFDLQNVQVLKGPQGTLFGRNSTGGAVLLVPNKPKDKTEGYIEGSAGNYNMWRVQGVANFAISETARMRVGFDHMDRHGYLKNIGRFGDGQFGNRGMGDVNYWAARASLVVDLAPDLENYTIFSLTHSQGNGVNYKTSQNPAHCLPGVSLGLANGAGTAPAGLMACNQAAREASYGFWTVSNRMPDAASIIDQWQAINTLTWKASDSLTVKHIFSYAEFRQLTNVDLFGNYFIRPDVTPGQERLQDVTGFAWTHAEASTHHTNAQSTMVNELQLQGNPGDGRFTWQAGAYLEVSNPLGYSGVQGPTNFSSCIDADSNNCPGAIPGISSGSGQFQISKTKFRNYALYGQASYKLTEQLTLSAGIRYTWDKMRSRIRLEGINYAAQTVSCSNSLAESFGTAFPISRRFEICNQLVAKDTSAPTWMVNLDWKPIDTVMVYGKWSRGYRQGGLALFGPDRVQPFEAEKVDTYEIGAKTNWRGSFPGYFNIAGFHNNFSNQQLLLGVSCDINLPNYKGACQPNAAIVNAGKSRLSGFEADVGVTAFDRLHLSAAYGYLNTRIKSVVTPIFPAAAPYNSVVSPLVGESLCPQIQFCNWVTGTIPHKLSFTAMLDLPLPESAGKLSIGGTVNYTSKHRIVTDQRPTDPRGQNVGVLPGSQVINLNATWQDVGGKPIDASFFVTNVTNEHVFLQANDSLLARGFVTYLIGEPRMWGFRLRYKFSN